MRTPVLLAMLPLLLPPVAAEPLIVAHRGASGEAPENTLPAFHLAWEQGADAIEGDFHLTRDGHIVCIHDDDTARVAGRSLKVSESTLAELRALDAGASFHARFAGTRIPTFAEVAATVPEEGKFYIEIKCGPAIVPRLVEETAALGLDEEDLVVISFHAEVIRVVKMAKPEWKAFWLSSFRGGGGLDPGPRKVLEILAACRADGLSSKADPRIDASFVAAIHEAGFEYHCWTIDEPGTALRFRDLGSRSITTNHPGRIREALR